MEPKQGELLVESWVEQPTKLEVDREKRLVRNVVLLGEHSKNGYDYDRGAMKAAAQGGLYNGVVIVDQHGGRERRVNEKMGAVVEARYVEVDGTAKIVGDVKAFANDAGNTFLDICEFAPRSAGMSHEARGEMAA